MKKLTLKERICKLVFPELLERIDELENEVYELESENQELDCKVEELESKLWSAQRDEDYRIMVDMSRDM
jgi:chaperonin cofactor prefoldin